MKYRIYANDISPSTLVGVDAILGDGTTTMDAFEKEFDGSVPAFDFELDDTFFQPAPTIEAEIFGIPVSERQQVQWEVAKVVQESYSAGWFQGREAHDELVHDLHELIETAVPDLNDVKDMRVLISLIRMRLAANVARYIEGPPEPDDGIQPPEEIELGGEG